MDALAVVSIFGALGSFAVVVIYFNKIHETRLRKLVESWAEGSGYRILECEQRWLRTGPYWMKSKSQNIYRTVIDDGRGHQRCAWLRCGGFLSPDNVDVEWEDA